jgi:tetratricopeptide (TPR) repeat protein
LLALKVRSLWNALQYDDLSIITNLREQGVIFPGLYFGLVAALSLPGMFLAWKTAPLSSWILAAIGFHMLALLPVFITERYRLPIVPGLLIFAAFGLVSLYSYLIAANFKPALAYCVLLVAATLFVSWPQHDSSLWALDAYNTGLQELESGNLKSARKKLDLAYAYSPLNAEVNFAQGNLRLAEGDTAAAKNFYCDVLQLNPRHNGAFNNLGVLALQENRWELAVHFFEGALVCAPNDAKSHYLLARTVFTTGNTKRALVEVERALKLEANQPEFLELREEILKRL